MKITLLTFLLLNSFFISKNIKDDKIYYNFISYENEIFVSSNKGVYKIDISKNDFLELYDETIIGPIKSDFTKNPHFKMKFLSSSNLDNLLPDGINLKSVTDITYKSNYLFVINNGNLIVYDLSYKFFPYESVRSITNSSVGTYNGVYVKGNKLKKITYTDGQIKEFEKLTFVCYNGLLSVENNSETILYDNDNSVRSNAQYGNIRDIYFIEASKYLVISTDGLYTYDFIRNQFYKIYSSESKIIPLKNKIDERIQDRNEFHFIDNNKYISINLKINEINIVEDKLKHKIKDVLECDINGNIFYAISENDFFVSYKRTKNGIKLTDEFAIKEAHTIADYDDLIFLLGNNGLSIFDKTKKIFFIDFIIDEFNSNAVFKSNNEISFGSIHGIYKILDVKNFYKNLVFKDYKIRNEASLAIVLITASVLFIFLILLVWFYLRRNIYDKDLIIKIKLFIQKNLNIVTLKMLEDEFNLDYYQINSLDKNFKPAKFIKKERYRLVKKMLLNNDSIDKISKKSGYSKTYLLKNKYQFIK
jgi:hypothetical protein